VFSYDVVKPCFVKLHQGKHGVCLGVALTLFVFIYGLYGPQAKVFFHVFDGKVFGLSETAQVSADHLHVIFRTIVHKFLLLYSIRE
jgi:hypothetical protein